MKSLLITLWHHVLAVWNGVAEHPCLWPFVFVVPCVLVFHAMPGSRVWQRLMGWRRTLGALGALVVLAVFVLLAGAYLRSSCFSDHVEPRSAILSWRFWNGQPVYDDLKTEERYNGTPYGPILYVVTGITQGLLGPSVFSTKLPVFLTNVMTVLLLFLSVRRGLPVATSLGFTAMGAALVLCQPHFGYGRLCMSWVRPDPMILFCVSAGTFAATCRNKWGSLLLGASLGAAVNLKINAGFCFLPIMVLAWRQRWGIKALLYGASAAMAVALSPYLLFPNISLKQYLAILTMNMGRSFDCGLWLPCFEWSTTLLLVGGLVAFMWNNADDGEGRQRPDWILFTSFCLAIAGIAYPAMLAGAGSYHLMPLIPVAVKLSAEAYGHLRSTPPSERVTSPIAAGLVCSWILFCGANACVQGVNLTRWYSFENHASAKAHLQDVAEIARNSHRNIILAAAGSTDAYPETYARVELAFRGMPVGIDLAAMMEFKNAGWRGPNLQSLVTSLEDNYKQPIQWICPKGVAPFSMHTYYEGTQYLFPKQFRDDFTANFKLTGQSKYYDIYSRVDRSHASGK